MVCDLPHVLITGAGSGIGEATVAAALDAGFHVFAGDRGVRDASAVANDGSRTRLRVDVTNSDDIELAAKVNPTIGTR